MIDAAASRAELIRLGTARIRAANVCADPARAARALWHDDSSSWLRTNTEIDPDVARAYLDRVERRVLGEPEAYITGVAGFRHLLVETDHRTLIPRPETEGLIDLALVRTSGGVAADIGTGTGVLALSLRREAGYDAVHGVDMSPAALGVAAANGRATRLEVNWLLADLTSAFADRSLDLVISNPPYLSRSEYDNLDRSVRDYEPEIALVSGDDGLDATRRLVHDAMRVCRPNGWLLLEVDTSRAGATAGLAASAGWTEATVIDDLFGRARYVVARRGADDDR